MANAAISPSTSMRKYEITLALIAGKGFSLHGKAWARFNRERRCEISRREGRNRVHIRRFVAIARCALLGWLSVRTALASRSGSPEERCRSSLRCASCYTDSQEEALPPVPASAVKPGRKSASGCEGHHQSGVHSGQAVLPATITSLTRRDGDSDFAP